MAELLFGVRVAAVGLAAFGAIVASTTLSEAQTVTYHGFTPAVILPGSTQPVRFEAQLSSSPTRVTIDFQPGLTGAVTSIELRDDGTAGDRQAGDRIYTVQLPPAPILSAERADDAHRVFVGFLNLFNGSTNVFRGNLFVDVYGSEAGAPSIRRLSQFVQATSYLVNIQDPAYFVSADVSHVTQEFYRWFGDDYDVLNVVFSPERFANRTHSIVKNDVQGIGLALSDNTARFGSDGRLRGYSQFPIVTFFDGAETGHIHELGHQWINFLNFPPFASGIPHWPKSTMATGVMGFSIGGMGGQGGDFACTILDQNGTIVLTPRLDAPAYNSLDLYLMGLLPADQVSPQIVFADQQAVAQLTCTGQAFFGPVLHPTVQDVIAQLGPRIPAFGDAPSRFRIGTILVTRDDLASRETMWQYSWFAQRAELQNRVPTHSGFLKQLGQPFYVATGGRGTLDMHIEFDRSSDQPDFSLEATPASQVVAAGSTAVYTVRAVPGAVGFDADVTFTCGALPPHASCVFSPSHATPGQSAAAVMLNVATRDVAQTANVSAGDVIRGGLVSLAFFRRSRRRASAQPVRLAWQAPLILVGLMCGIEAGCGGTGQSPSTTTPPGYYVITITGNSAAMQRTTTVSLTVQ